MTTESKDSKNITQSENVVDFHSFRRKKAEEEYLARGRKPLYVSHSRGHVQGRTDNQHLSDFSDRIANLRYSLEKINALMADLKKLSMVESEDHEKTDS